MAGIDHEGQPYHFKILGFPVHVGWQFFLIAVLVASSRPLSGLVTWVGVVFVSVLIHELGHALAFRAFGSPARIQLWGMGGLTYGRSPAKRWQEVVVSLAGPVPPLLLVGLPAFIAYAVGVGGDNLFVRQLVLDIWWANLFWSVINLLPILPMDGGRLVDTLAGRATARVLSAGTALLAAPLILALGLGPIMFVFALLVAGYNVYSFTKEQKAGVYERDARMRRVISDAKASGAPPGTGKAPVTPAAAWAALELGDVAGAARVGAKLGEAAPPLLTGTLLAAQGDPASSLAWLVTGLMVDDAPPAIADRIMAETGVALPVAEAIHHSGDPRATEVLDRFQARLRDRGHVALAAELAERRAQAAGAQGGRAWYETARLWAKVGDPSRVVAALHQSVSLGHASPALVVGDPSFSRMFDHPEFADYVATLR